MGVKSASTVAAILSALAVAAVCAGSSQSTPQDSASSLGSQQVRVGKKADDNCTLGKPTALLKDLPGTKVARFRRGRELQETIRLPDLVVEVTQGGCIHYGVKFAFKGRGGQATGAQQSLVGETFALMERLKPHTNSPAVAEVLAILRSWRGDAYRAGEPLQDTDYPQVTLYITERTSERGRVLELTYSFVP